MQISKKVMNLLDIVFFGWYHILDKTIYSSGTERGSIGPKEHSFFITFLFHGINLWTTLRFLTASYFEVDIPFYLSLSLAVVVFGVGYLFYYKRIAETHSVNKVKAILFVLIALAYVAASVYLMFRVGDYVRYKLGN